jgi:eukaryotic-like serine/threonine-protein kinase
MDRSAETVGPPALVQAGPYTIERLIGQGAMGAVYLAREPRTGRAVAIKTLALDLAGAAAGEWRERFAREAGAARRLHHEGIVAVVAHGQERGLAWIAMEHAPGHDLGRHVTAAGRLTLAEVLAIGAQLADALAHAHRQGVVHRDLKPANVIFDPATGIARLTDFGIARVADASRTRTGLVLGTPAYMPPEQIAGLAVDGRADLYALGVLLFELLCARLPFEAATLGALMNQIANRPPPDIRSLRPELPEALAAIVARALAKRPDQRPASGDEMVHSLRAVAASVKFSRTDPRHNSAD